MDRTKIVIVVLVILVVVFFLGVGLGATQGGRKQSNLNVAWARDLHQLLVPQRHLTLKDIDWAVPEECTAQGQAMIVPAQGDCTLGIGASSLPERQVVLRLNEGALLQVRLRQNVQDGKPWTSSQTIRRGEETEGLGVYKQGGTLILSCQDLGRTCRLALR